MLDHVTLGVRDIVASGVFYDAVLAPIGIVRLYSEGETFLGYGACRKAFFWIGATTAPVVGVHVAFSAADRATVDRFHATTLICGAQDNGAPGLRPRYHPNYYGAFVLDPDGHNIEAVCHSPP